ncbi:sensor histidine kinase [Sphingomonas sp. JC676]|uniref:sensor histidine kinase n=1 Tax=Sphingomonas sp. JC676 TaxID=2768065 RepID=UPI00223B1DCF|nr:sensor histidine kinase [Sphingomonas sp. JC676]
MIHDHDQVTLQVESDESLVGANVSVSLGLVVTELVINSLKHAFPEARHGKIMVSYRSKGVDWALSVADDGVGMPTEPQLAKPGLGTSIIQALADQLGAHITVLDGMPGTVILLEHAQPASAATGNASHAAPPI